MFFKKKKKEVEIKEEKIEEITPKGWDAITEIFEKVYPGQKRPLHYTTKLPWELGGNDPLQGISVYDGGDYYHFVSYGLSDLYDKSNKDDKYSGYGMEFTLKLKKKKYKDLDKELKNIAGIFQQLARTTFTRGELYKPFEYIYTGQTVGIDFEQKSKLTGFITILDEEVGSIDTPNGIVDFVELIGVHNSELERLLDKKTTVKELYKLLGSDITDYNRPEVKFKKDDIFSKIPPILEELIDYLIKNAPSKYHQMDYLAIMKNKKEILDSHIYIKETKKDSFVDFKDLYVDNEVISEKRYTEIKDTAEEIAIKLYKLFIEEGQEPFEAVHIMKDKESKVKVDFIYDYKKYGETPKKRLQKFEKDILNIK